MGIFKDIFFIIFKNIMMSILFLILFVYFNWMLDWYVFYGFGKFCINRFNRVSKKLRRINKKFCVD